MTQDAEKGGTVGTARGTVKAPDNVQAIIDASEERLVAAARDEAVARMPGIPAHLADEIARAIVRAYQREHTKIIEEMAAAYGKKP